MYKIHWHILICILIGLFATQAAAAQDVSYAKRIVKRLASPAFKGRGYVQNGTAKTAAFIAREFMKFGLEPVLQDSYDHNFNIDVNTFPGKVYLELDNDVLTPAVDYLVSASSPSVKGRFKIIRISRAALNFPNSLNALTANAHNAFILIDNRKGKDESQAERNNINKNIARLEFDDKLNFKGLILYSHDKLTWTTANYQSTRPVILLNKKDLNPDSVQEIQINIEAILLKNHQEKNVIGLVKGTSVPDSMLLITAHYDHLGMLGKKVYFPGANDNASGMAMLLSMAKYYSKNPGKYTMVFIAFSAEEAGLLGSDAFVKQPLIDLKKIKFLTNFDLAGTGEEGIRVVNGTVYPDKFEQLLKLNAQYKLLPKIDSRGAACNSDHCRFYQQGVPCFFIYTQGGIRAYHDVYDRASTLPLSIFDNYFRLMLKFFAQF